MPDRFYGPGEKPLDAEYTQWFHTYLRPALGWSYLVICVFDFMVAPILLGIYSYYEGTYHAWEPLTIRGGGIYHLSMGAILGVSMWTRGREKIRYMDNEDSGSGDDDGPGKGRSD